MTRKFWKLAGWGNEPASSSTGHFVHRAYAFFDELLRDAGVTAMGTQGAREVVMERALIAVEPDERGWQVRIADYEVVRNVDKFSAIQRASELARDCYESIGVPSGVRVRMLCGDNVMVGSCG